MNDKNHRTKMCGGFLCQHKKSVRSTLFHGPGGNRTRVRKPIHWASPIAVAVLTFPRSYARRQAYDVGSFMIHLPGQSLPDKVSHIVDARFLKCECKRADEQLRLLTLTFRLRLYLIPGFYAVPESADGFPNCKTPVETSTSPDV